MSCILFCASPDRTAVGTLAQKKLMRMVSQILIGYTTIPDISLFFKCKINSYVNKKKLRKGLGYYKFLTAWVACGDVPG